MNKDVLDLKRMTVSLLDSALKVKDFDTIEEIKESYGEIFSDIIYWNEQNDYLNVDSMIFHISDLVKALEKADIKEFTYSSCSTALLSDLEELEKFNYKVVKMTRAYTRFNETKPAILIQKA